MIVNLPAVLKPGTLLSLTVLYGGRIAPQVFDREAIQVGGVPQEQVYMPIEQRWLYSNRSYWYPQPTVTDYATARLRITSRATRRRRDRPPLLPEQTAGTAARRGPIRDAARRSCSMPRSRPDTWRLSSAGSIRSPRRIWWQGTRRLAIRTEQPEAGRAGSGAWPKRRRRSSLSMRRSSATRRTRASRSRQSRAIAREATARRISRCSTRWSSAPRSRGGTTR